MPTHQQRIKDITDSIEQGIRDLFASDKYTHYLRTMSRSARQPSAYFAYIMLTLYLKKTASAIHHAKDVNDLKNHLRGETSPYLL